MTRSLNFASSIVLPLSCLKCFWQIRLIFICTTHRLVHICVHISISSFVYVYRDPVECNMKTLSIVTWAPVNGKDANSSCFTFLSILFSRADVTSLKTKKASTLITSHCVSTQFRSTYFFNRVAWLAVKTIIWLTKQLTKAKIPLRWDSHNLQLSFNNEWSLYKLYWKIPNFSIQ